jgi:hypothetical protein
MHSSNSIPLSHDDSSQSSTLQVDFSYKKFQALITEVVQPSGPIFTEHDKPSNPVYTVDFHIIKAPHMIVKSAIDSTTVGTGTLHPISIHADYEIHGQKRQLKALKRFKTSYTHLSSAFSSTSSPVTMTWTSKCGFKTWDFICLDEQQNAVAKFTANVWAVKKMGNIEFLGLKANSQAAREEIIITGLTLFYCILLRSTSILSFFGAIFVRLGPIESEVKVD